MTDNAKAPPSAPTPMAAPTIKGAAKRERDAGLAPEALARRHRKAVDRRRLWEGVWREAYDFAMPLRETAVGGAANGAGGAAGRIDRLFDGTAPDAVDQLAASLLAQLTPPWARWFGLAPGTEVPEADRARVARTVEKAATVLQSHFDRSNFSVEMHQCYLDLVTAGTASLLFEEAPAGDESAFRFTAVPLGQVAFEEDASGRLETTFRATELTVAQLTERFPRARLPQELTEGGPEATAAEKTAEVLEAVVPAAGGFAYRAMVQRGGDGSQPVALAEGRFAASPFINFRWLKAPGEIYGRSPVMKALPDIKTANKVVELILKNASIAVTGIWQADDDGVLNPSTIRLTPGTIIPKAVGSAGLTPLSAPGRMDTSQIVLDQLRANIRRALLADKLGQVDAPKMTATEVLERVAEMNRLLGATYGRLQSELLTPLVTRAVAILRRRGEIDDIAIDGRAVDLEYKSPLARNQARQDVQNTRAWIEALLPLGPEAAAVVDARAAALALARAYGVPQEVIRDPAPANDAAPLPTTTPLSGIVPPGLLPPGADPTRGGGA